MNITQFIYVSIIEEIVFDIELQITLIIIQRQNTPEIKADSKSELLSKS